MWYIAIFNWNNLLYLFKKKHKFFDNLYIFRHSIDIDTLLEANKDRKQKNDKVIGILLICTSILMLLLVPNDLIFLLFLDSGLLNLII